MSVVGSIPIHHWSEDDRPREKLLTQGAQALSNAELLAILIGSGPAKINAVSLMANVLNQCNNNLNALGKLSAKELMAFHGIGIAKAVTILAACELGKRRAREQVLERCDLSSAQSIYEYMHTIMSDLSVEKGWVLYLNRAFKLIKTMQVSQGGLTETAVDVRLVVKEALLCNATVVVFCHNHPSNNPQPSMADDQLTKQLKQGCEFLRLYFLDHLVITDGQYYSYREEGLL